MNVRTIGFVRLSSSSAAISRFCVMGIEGWFPCRATRQCSRATTSLAARHGHSQTIAEKNAFVEAETEKWRALASTNL
jgi:hypothetical protein